MDAVYGSGSSLQNAFSSPGVSSSTNSTDDRSSGCGLYAMGSKMSGLRSASPNSISIVSALSLLSGMPLAAQGDFVVDPSANRGAAGEACPNPVHLHDNTSEEDADNSEGTQSSIICLFIYYT